MRRAWGVRVQGPGSRPVPPPPPTLLRKQPGVHKPPSPLETTEPLSGDVCPSPGRQGPRPGSRLVPPAALHAAKETAWSTQTSFSTGNHGASLWGCLPEPGASGSQGQVHGSSPLPPPTLLRKQPGVHLLPRWKPQSLSLGMSAHSHVLSSVIRVERKPQGFLKGRTPEARPHLDPRGMEGEQGWRRAKSSSGGDRSPAWRREGHGSSASSTLFPGKRLSLQRLPVRGPHLTVD